MKRRSLATRLRAAHALVRESRKIIYDSERIHSPGTTEHGQVSDATRRYLARFDEAMEAIAEAIKLAGVPHA